MALSATFIACQKEEAPALVASSAAEADVTPRIKAFIERAASMGAAKSAGTMSLDSAEWYIEAGLNFDLGAPWKDCTDRALDSLEVTIPVGSEGISESDAHAAYSALHTGIASKLVAGENHLIMADVSLVYNSGTEAVAEVLLLFGSGYSKTNQLITTYGPNEFIYYGFGNIPNNNCGCESNNGGASPCADIRIAHRVSATLDGLSHGCYYTNVESRGVDWIWNANNLTINATYSSFPTGIPATPYKIYRCTGESCTNCFSPSMMSFYTQGSYDMMTQLKPTNKIPISCTMDDLSILGGPSAAYWHIALYTYAKLNCHRN